MPEFDPIRQQLNAARDLRSRAQQALFVSQEKLNKIKRQQEDLRHIYNERNEDHVAQRHRLEELEQSTLAELERYRTEHNRAQEVEGGLVKQFEAFTDPRRQLSQLNDAFPLLLFPVRIETRFKKITIREQTQDQLWVRIYPDDGVVDTFEKVLSETEVKNVQYYWVKLWEAGGDEGGERAAWRSLVASHGSGRASYIVEQYVPANMGAKPVKEDKDDMLLVVAAEQLPTASEQTALEEYWKQVWLANGDKGREASAYQTLVITVGAGQAAALVDQYKPANLDVVPAPPKTKEDVQVQVVYLQLPPSGDMDTKLQSWSQPPQVTVMPDRFILMGYQGGQTVFEAISSHPVPSPLIVGPDPNAPPEEQFAIDDNGNLVIPEEMRWMVDFDAAIEKGLGFKIDLTPQQAVAGFDRIIAIGVRLSADATEGQQQLETLIEHHRFSRKGFSLIKQGTPTNNTEAQSAGYQNTDNPDESFDERKKGQLFEIETDPLLKKDGQWLAEFLGIRYESVYNIKNSGHTDQSEGRLMNIALWPATMGYMMETLMQPVFTEDDIAHTRNFFNHFVSGRGLLPAIKIGRQPYGLLPTTAFSNIKWFNRRDNIPALRLFSNTAYMARLYAVLQQMDNDWSSLLNGVSYIGKEGDAHQLLLNVLGLNAASVEFYQRTAESREDLFNRFNLMGLGGAFLAALIAGGYTKSGQDLLQRYGYTGNDMPDILNKFFIQSQNLLKGPLIDDRPLSEADPIRNYTPAPDAKNYMAWLIEAAQTSHDTLRRQQGFIDEKIPTALLYLMLHHALDLSYVEVSLELFQRANILSQAEARVAKQEPAFLHIQQSSQRSESKWHYLYSNEPRITGNTDLLIGNYIPQVLKTEVASAYLNDQLNALELLKDVPTARLERAFVEHIDCCSYRLDAWKNGIIHYGLSQMRQSEAGGNETYKKGIYIGAYGWLENVRPENKQLTPVELRDTELYDLFIKDQPTPLVKDATNGGYIMAPSLNHAVTASVLRNGYISNDNPDALRVNLSSERVRKALSVIEGIRAGQSLGALLGYYLERGLHDGHPGIELDYFIYQLRKAFPLTTNRNKDTKVDETSDQPIDSVEAIEARNVVDGLALIEHIKTSGNTTYPFGKSFLPPVDTAAQATAINEEVQRIMDINDAIADMALAESVHQMAQGNSDRGAATLDTYSKGNFPPIPEVIQTPRSGTNITHRIGLHFETGLDPVAESTPRAQAEPGMNRWLKSVLPHMADMACLVSYGTVTDEVVTISALGLQPIDLLYLLNTDSQPAMHELDDRIVKWVMDKPSVRPDTAVAINYMKRIPNKISFFELAPLLNSLRSLLLRSKVLLPNDIMLPKDAKQPANSNQYLNATRIQLWYTALQTAVSTSLFNYQTAINALTGDMVANRNQLLTQFDTLLADYTHILFDVGKTGLPQTGFGFIYGRKRMLYAQLITKLNELILRWNEKLTAFDNLINEYNALPATATDEEKFTLLQKARAHISTLFPIALPPNPDMYKGDILALRGLFVTKQNHFKALHASTTPSLSVLLTNVKAALPISDFDTTPFEVIDVENDSLLLLEEIGTKANHLYTDLNTRLSKAKTILDEAATITDSAKKVDTLLNAAKLLFGEEFKIIPEFSLTGEQANEWANAYAAKDQLLSHSITKENSDFPVDDWLYGIARVREKLQHWENTVVLTEAFGGNELTLHPVQLPYKNNDSWLALAFPEDYDIESDRLLYTAHYATAFDKAKKQCGLLLDEWTELIPAKKETAGVAFHYDRPNAEPPQVWLLALPTEFKGAWEWQDLVDTINETLQMAKKRAIESAHIDATDYARFLPAIVSSMTTHPITSFLNLSFNNHIHEALLNASHE